MRKTFGGLLVVAAMTFSGVVLAQTSEEQAACRSDAIKHCSSFVGKQDDMKKCLATNKDKLSAPCKKVVESRGG